MERCRTCAKFEDNLNSKKWRQLYPTTQRDLVDIRELLRSWNIKFERKDQFGQKICDVCYNNFCLVQKFRENCKHADKIIRSNIKDNTASNSLMEFTFIEKKCIRDKEFPTDSSDVELKEWNSDKDDNLVKQQNVCHTNVKNDCVTNVLLSSTVIADVDENMELKVNRELDPLSLIDVENEKTTYASRDEIRVDGCTDEIDPLIDTQNAKIKNISQVADVVFDVFIDPVDSFNLIKIQTAKITRNSKVADVLDVSIDKETESTAVLENTSNKTGAHDDNDDEYEKRNDIICSLEHDFLNEECSEAENELISQLVTQIMVTEKKQVAQEKTDQQKEEKKKGPYIWKRNTKYDEIKPNPLLCIFCVSYNAKDLLHHTVEDLEAHKQKVHSNADNPINCLICNQFFKDEDEVHLHLKDKHIPGENCLICGKFSRRRLDLHIGTHLKSSYTCEICGLVMKESTKKQFNYHKRWHNSKEQLQCPHKGCTKTFLQRHHLNEHIGRWHTGQRQFICTKCGMGFNVINQLKKHNFKIHKGESIIKCSLCNETFNTYVQKQTHMNKIHPSTSQLTCNICNKSFKSDNRLWQHVQKMHDTSPQLRKTSKNQKINPKHKTQKKVPPRRGIFECSYCNHRTNAESSLIRHQVKHTPDVSRPFSCQECYSFFKTMINLRTHQKLLHLKEKPFKCNICDKSFSLNWSLQNHIKTHYPAKLDCDQCERKFKTNLCLRNHQLKKHEKSFRFKCDYCDEKFLCHKQRIEHMKKKHEDLYYRTTVNNSYSQRVDLVTLVH